MKIEQNPPVKVAGVYKDFPQNSRFRQISILLQHGNRYNANNNVKGT